jgi:hypothetical protein
MSEQRDDYWPATKAWMDRALKAEGDVASLRAQLATCLSLATSKEDAITITALRAELASARKALRAMVDMFSGDVRDDCKCENCKAVRDAEAALTDDLRHG